MALTNIGARIGLEGAKEYRNDILKVIQSNKELAAEAKSLESAFSGNKIESNLKNLKAALKSQMDGLVRELEMKKERLQKALDWNTTQQGMIGLNWADRKDMIPEEDFVKLRTEIAQTEGKINDLHNRMKDLPSTAKLFTEAWRNSTSEVGELLKGIGDALTKYVTLPIVTFGGTSLKSFMDWETAFTGVRKTVEGSEEDFQLLADGIQEMALRTASSSTEIAGVMEVAGQLGIEGVEELLRFTETMVMLGDTTNVSAEEAAMSLAKVLNITKERKDIRRLGASIVDLGNNFATTEADIIAMTNRLAAGGTLAGLTTTEILALATAMSSVGITAEAGGTAMTQTLTAIEKEFAAFTSGAESNLGRIAEISGMSAEEFAKSWEETPIKAIEAFIDGLGSLDEKGGNAVLVLDELGMAGIRQSNMLKSLGEASTELSRAIEMADKAYDSEHNAMVDEAAKRYETFETKVGHLKEAFEQLKTTIGADLGDKFGPAIEKLTDILHDLAEGWKNLDQPTKDAILNIAGFLAVVGPVMSIAGRGAIGLAKLKSAFEILAGTGGAAGATKAVGDLIGVGGGGTAVGTGLKGLIGSVSGGTIAIGGLLGALGLLVVDLTTNEEAAKKMGEQLNKTKKEFEETTGYVYDLGDPSGAGGWYQTADEYGNIITHTAHLIKTEAQDTANVVKTQSAETKAALEEGLIDLKGGVIGNLTETSDKVKYFSDQIKTAMTSSSQEARQNTKAEYDALSGEIILTTDNLNRTLPPKFKELGDKVSQEGETTKQKYKMVLTGIEDETKKVNLKTAGEHMMDTLRQGIELGRGGVISAAIGIAKGIKAYLEFSLPEKGPLAHFDKAMPDMMMLMAKGIDDNAYLVEDALSNVAGMMSTRATDTGENLNYNYGGVVINLNVPEGANGAMLVDEIENELAQRTVRRRAVFG